MSTRAYPVAQDVHAPMEGWTKAKWYGIQLLRRSAMVMTLHDSWVGSKPYPYDKVRRNGLVRLKRDLTRFQTLAKHYGCQPVMAVIPDARHVRGPHPTAELALEAAKLAEEKDLMVIPLVPPLRSHYESSGEIPVLAYDGHYAELGNRLMGEYLAGEFLERGVGSD